MSLTVQAEMSPDHRPWVCIMLHFHNVQTLL